MGKVTTGMSRTQGARGHQPRDHLAAKKSGLDSRLTQFQQGPTKVGRKGSADGQAPTETPWDNEHHDEDDYHHSDDEEPAGEHSEEAGEDAPVEEGEEGEQHEEQDPEAARAAKAATLNLPEDWVEKAKRQAEERAEEERKRREAEDFAEQERRAEEARKRLEEEEEQFLKQAEEQKRKAEEARQKREREAAERRRELAEKAAAEVKAERARAAEAAQAAHTVAATKEMSEEDLEKAKRKARVAEIMARAKAGKGSPAVGADGAGSTSPAAISPTPDDNGVQRSDSLSTPVGTPGVGHSHLSVQSQKEPNEEDNAPPSHIKVIVASPLPQEEVVSPATETPTQSESANPFDAPASEQVSEAVSEPVEAPVVPVEEAAPAVEEKTEAVVVVEEAVVAVEEEAVAVKTLPVEAVEVAHETAVEAVATLPAPVASSQLDASATAPLSISMDDFEAEERAAQAAAEQEELARNSHSAEVNIDEEIPSPVAVAAPAADLPHEPVAAPEGFDDDFTSETAPAAEETFDGFGQSAAPPAASSGSASDSAVKPPSRKYSFNPFDAPPAPVDVPATWQALEASFANDHKASSAEEAQWAKLLTCA